MVLFTIGFTKKPAKKFFNILKENEVCKVIDVRVNNNSQLAGFTKEEDLKFFLKELLNIEYIHEVQFAPTKELLTKYNKGIINWEEYEKTFNEILQQRNICRLIKDKYNFNFEKNCLLCSEVLPNYCHRRLVGEYLQKFIPDLKLIHL